MKYRIILSAVVAAGILACAPHQSDETRAHDSDTDHHDSYTPSEIELGTDKLFLAEIEYDTAVYSIETSLSVTGTVGYNDNLVSHIGSRTEGRVIRLMADLGTRVVAGQKLAVLESPLLGQIRAEEREGEALYRISRENFLRDSSLFASGISTRKEYLAGELEYRKAEALLNGARERLAALGAVDGEGSTFMVVAPFDGAVVEKHISLGEMVTPSDHLFTVADLSNLWAQLEIFERDMSAVRLGQTVTISTPAFPGRRFHGTVSHIGAVVDSVKKTVQARIALPNPDRALKPGMFIEAGIHGAPRPSGRLVIAATALQKLQSQSAGSKDVIFVQSESKPGRFSIVEVRQHTNVSDTHIAIDADIQAGARVVSRGSHLLKAELSKDQLDGHAH